jgi:hypothetical protein
MEMPRGPGEQGATGSAGFLEYLPGTVMEEPSGAGGFQQPAVALEEGHSHGVLEIGQALGD